MLQKILCWLSVAGSATHRERVLRPTHACHTSSLLMVHAIDDYAPANTTCAARRCAVLEVRRLQCTCQELAQPRARHCNCCISQMTVVQSAAFGARMCIACDHVQTARVPPDGACNMSCGGYNGVGSDRIRRDNCIFCCMSAPTSFQAQPRTEHTCLLRAQTCVQWQVMMRRWRRRHKDTCVKIQEISSDIMKSNPPATENVTPVRQTLHARVV